MQARLFRILISMIVPGLMLTQTAITAQSNGQQPTAIPALPGTPPEDGYKLFLISGHGSRPASEGLTLDQYYARYPSQRRGVSARAVLVINYFNDVNSQDASPGDAICADSHGRCGLRAAIMEASALNNGSTITIPAGTTITLAAAGAGENGGVTGDLDIHGDLTIAGGGADNTTIDASGIDRVLDVFGGAIVDIRDLTIKGGDASLDTAHPYGGGLWINCNGDVMLTRVNVANNHADVAGGIGTGTGCDTSTNNLYLYESAVFKNNADNGGAGIRIYQGGYFGIRNSTISNNKDLNRGAGLLIEEDGSNPAPTGVITQTTIAQNTSSTYKGSGLYLGRTVSVIIANSIVAYNRYGAALEVSDCFVSPKSILRSDGDNVYTSATCPAESDDVVDPALNLGLLEYNYPGATPTHALYENSSAVDLDNDTGTCPSTDQRNVDRPQGNACDAGSYEFDGSATELIRNGRFEDITATPWMIKNPTGERITCKPGTQHSGSCAFLFKGGVGEQSKIQQFANVSGITFQTGDTISLSVWLKNKTAQPGKIKTVIVYGNGSRSKISHPLDATDGYSNVRGSVNLVSGEVTKIKSYLSFRGMSGRLYIDDFSLKLLPGGTALTNAAGMSAQILPLPLPSSLIRR